MSNEKPDRDELTSWKEIAAYLGVVVRTAQIWERDRGLPVRRLPGGRGRVSASVAEIEAWKQSASVLLGPPGDQQPVLDSTPHSAIKALWARLTPRWRSWILVLALASSIPIAAFIWPAGRFPVSATVSGNSVLALDAHGREMWRATFDSMAPTGPDSVWVGDLDGDGVNEVHYNHGPNSGTHNQRFLICYDAKGHERWRFRAGKAVRTRTETFANSFGVQSFLVARFGESSQPRIVFTAQHFLDYPCQIGLLDAGGKLLREYWHSGHLPHLLTIEHRGTVKLLAGGVANSLDRATAVLLDPQTMGGASAESDSAFQLLGFPPGNEQARLFFPRSCINERVSPFPHVARLWRQEDEIIAAVAHAGGEDALVHYHLDLSLALRSVGLSSDFEVRHAQLRFEKKIDHDLSEAEIAALRTISPDD